MNFLSNRELDVVKNTEFLLIKNKILDKIRSKLSETSSMLVAEIKADFPHIYERFGIESPKISRGEKYHGLPYLVLDYPRFFDKGNTFSFRTTFLWGHYVNCSLHVEGDMVDLSSLENRWKSLSKQDLYVCLHSTPWEHYLTKPYFAHISSMNAQDLQKHYHANQFIKIASRLEYGQLENLPDLVSLRFRSLVDFLYPSLPE